MTGLATAWYSRLGKDGEGITIFVNADGGTAGTYYIPGGTWYGLFDFTWNPLRRQYQFAIAKQDQYNVPPIQVGTGAIRDLDNGATVEVSLTIGNLLDGDTFVRIMPAGAVTPPPFPPPPPPPEPPIEPIPPVEPGVPVLPPGVVGQLNVISTSWAQLFGGEFGQTGWRLQPPARLLNRPGGLCDVLSIAFRAPTVASGFDHGRFTQPIDGGGTLLLWYSRPGQDLLALAQADPRAWTNGTQITWELAGVPGSPQDRYQFEPGEVYCLNAAFLKPELITDGTVLPANPNGGEFALTATQQG